MIKDVDAEASDTLPDEPTPAVRAYRRALALLVSREHSRWEVQHKLGKRGYHCDAIEAVLDRLVDEGYLSDARFAESFAAQRAAKGFGCARIRVELSARGVGLNLADRAIDSLDTDWGASALRVLSAKCRPSDDYGKMRQILQRRGFPASVARAAVARFQRDECRDALI